MTRSPWRLVVLAAFLCLWASRVSADPITIDFEDIDDLAAVGTSIPGLAFTNATVLTAEFTLFEEETPPFSGDKVAFDDGVPCGSISPVPWRKSAAASTTTCL